MTVSEYSTHCVIRIDGFEMDTGFAVYYPTHNTLSISTTEPTMGPRFPVPCVHRATRPTTSSGRVLRLKLSGLSRATSHRWPEVLVVRFPVFVCSKLNGFRTRTAITSRQQFCCKIFKTYRANTARIHVYVEYVPYVVGTFQINVKRHFNWTYVTSWRSTLYEYIRIRMFAVNLYNDWIGRFSSGKT